MTLRELKKIIDNNLANLQEWADKDVVVAIKGNGIGGTPCLKVTYAYSGFDWDAGKFILKTEGGSLRKDKE